MKTAVGPPGKMHPEHLLYVIKLERTIRALDKLMPVPITAEHPEDHGLDHWMAKLIVELRRG